MSASSDWDVTVIGSGLGGMTSAACLAAEGKRVLVLEHDTKIGGHSGGLRRQGRWEFDVGVQHVGGCVPGSDGMIPTVLRGLGIEDRVEFSRFDDDAMETVSFPHHSFRVPTSWEGFTRELCTTFPADAAGLARCLTELRGIAEGVDRINDVPHSFRVIVPLLKRPREAATIARGLEQPIGRLFDRCGLSPEARAAVLYLVHIHNTAPAKTPALLIAFLLHHYFKSGTFFPTRGGQAITASLAEVIQAHGGTIRTDSTVRRIDIQSGRVCGVTMQSGERIRADVVVSNADAHRTFLDLVGRQHLPGRTLRRINALRRPHSIFTLFVAADLDLSKTRPATNYVSHGRYDIQRTFDLMDQGRWDPDGWLGISSATLKTAGRHPFDEPGHTTISAFAPVPDGISFWGAAESKAHHQRTSEIGEVLLQRTIDVLPELRGHVVFSEASTPVSRERSTLSWMPYGPENARDQIGPRRLRVTTPIGGLYLAGASTVFMYGVAFTMRGGVGTASAILGRDLMRDFHAGRVIADPAALPEHGPDWDPHTVCRQHTVKKPRPAPEPVTATQPASR